MKIKKIEDLLYEVKNNQIKEMGDKRIINDGLFFYAINQAGDLQERYFWKNNNVDEIPFIEQKFVENICIKYVFISNEYQDWRVDYITK